MKIPKEQFQKLKQLDRIEFILRNENIQKQFNSSNYSGTFIANFNQAIAIVFFGFMFLLLIKLAFGMDLFLRLVPLYILVTRLMLIFIAFMFVLYLVFAIVELIQYKKARKELFDQFFEIQTKTTPITLSLPKKTVTTKRGR